MDKTPFTLSVSPPKRERMVIHATPKITTSNALAESPRGRLFPAHAAAR
ncbi:MAG TPA: hypothetical protein VGO96_00250 [Pyrinomonadaceae bacterium]|jgi:hypothetical protein|nr:hypothetical protein [Pyrinomonadaceae bacterium]